MVQDCLFCKIIRGEIPSDKVFENEKVIAFKDINPAAPQHILVVPKEHKASLNEYDDSDKEILGELLLRVKNIAGELGLSNYRTVINTGREACQSVFHLHLHLIAGRELKWVH